VLQETGQEQSTSTGVATIEAEGAFIEIGIQMLCDHLSLVGSEQPAFEEGSQVVHKEIVE